MLTMFGTLAIATLLMAAAFNTPASPADCWYPGSIGTLSSLIATTLSLWEFLYPCRGPVLSRDGLYRSIRAASGV